MSEIGQLRKAYGRHLKLYRLIPVTETVVKKEDVEKYNSKNEVEDFDYSLIKEYTS